MLLAAIEVRLYGPDQLERLQQADQAHLALLARQLCFAKAHHQAMVAVSAATCP
ncbi:MAG: hypothetical protein K2R98_23865 [Gemmataceae bacterium]|nr:hypothetical protein [Gemmataceae bacterium]